MPEVLIVDVVTELSYRVLIPSYLSVYEYGTLYERVAISLPRTAFNRLFI